MTKNGTICLEYAPYPIFYNNEGLTHWVDGQLDCTLGPKTGQPLLQQYQSHTPGATTTTLTVEVSKGVAAALAASANA